MHQFKLAWLKMLLFVQPVLYITGAQLFSWKDPFSTIKWTDNPWPQWHILWIYHIIFSALQNQLTQIMNAIAAGSLYKMTDLDFEHIITNQKWLFRIIYIWCDLNNLAYLLTNCLFKYDILLYIKLTDS